MRYLLLLVMLVLSTRCTPDEGLLSGDPDNGGLVLPEGFEAIVVTDSIPGKAQHLAVRENGDIFVKLRYPNKKGNCIALRDRNKDGKTDVFKYFGHTSTTEQPDQQTGMRLFGDYLYFSTPLEVSRIKLPGYGLKPKGGIETIIRDDHEDGIHQNIAKPLTFDDQDNLYLPYGAPSNACQYPDGTPGLFGLDPCPQLSDYAGIWRFDANQLNQTQKDGDHFATGIRRVSAMAWNPTDQNLYTVIHAREDLHQLFPGLYSPWQSAILPSEEFVQVTEGADFGWPYCYFDQLQKKKILAPEYGGDGTIVGRCSNLDAPALAFPGHWSSSDLLFYQGDQFPERYKNGAFIAFHGSTKRNPYPQAGYFICFVPFEDGKPKGNWEVFADGFAGTNPIVNAEDAAYRPMGMALGPDGSLYFSDAEKGKIWRILYRGDKAPFGEAQLSKMEGHKQLPHIKRPVEGEEIIQKKSK